LLVVRGIETKMSSPQEDVPSFDLSLKKKKKKASSKVAEVTEEVEKLSVEDKKEEENVAAKPEEGAEDELFSDKKKKKKSSSKKVKIATEEPEEDNAAESNETESAAPAEGQAPWANSDRDYSYEELAGRIYNLLQSNNPDFVSKTKRYVMKPPVLNRIGTKKTAWSNFLEICTILHRKPDHFMNFVLTELGTNGSVDGSYALIIKGRFQPKQIETVIRHYITEYVACRTCRSPETYLKKENRLYFLCCQTCGSTRSVAAIKKGFEAQVGKRKKMAA